MQGGITITIGDEPLHPLPQPLLLQPERLLVELPADLLLAVLLLVEPLIALLLADLLEALLVDPEALLVDLGVLLLVGLLVDLPMLLLVEPLHHLLPLPLPLVRPQLKFR